MNKRIYLSPPDLTGNELAYVQDAIASNWVTSVGPYLQELAIDLKKKTGSNFVLPVNSGTSAIHLALMALQVEKGDIVFCPTFTFAATVFPVCYQNATPIFIDSEEATWNMDPILLEQAIVDALQQNKKPKAIIVAHIYGFPAQIEKICKIAQTYKLEVIEDAAEALGSTYNNQHVGSFSAVGLVSFNGNKITTGGNGGALFTDDVVLYDRMNRLSNQAKEDKPYYEHAEVGYNYRMCNVNAAIVRAQIEQLDLKIAKKKVIRAWYKKHLAGIVAIKHSLIGTDNAWLTCICLPKNIHPEKIINALERNGIESRRLWNPMHQQPVFKDAVFYSSGVSDSIFNQGVCLPSGTSLNEEDIVHIVAIIKQSL